MATEYVTDPDILAQLNGSQAVPTNKKYITDPSILAQLGSAPTKEPSALSGILSQLGQGVKDIPQNLLGLAQGASDAIVNLPAQVANIALSKSSQLPTFQSGEGLAYDVGKIGGEIGSYFVGGALADAAKTAPYIGKLAEALSGSGIGGMAGRAGGAALFGAGQNPDNAGRNAALGAGTSLLFDAVPGAFKGAAKLAEKVNPVKYTNDLVSSIRGNYNAAKKESDAFYDPVLEKHGSLNVLPWATKSEYKSIEKNIIPDFYDTDLMKMHRNFLSDPTLQKAHDLQSQLDTEIRALQPKSNETKNRHAISGLRNARDALKKDMMKQLSLRDPSAVDMYKQGSKIFAKKVGPYRKNSVINDIAEGDRETITPTQLQSALTKLTEKKVANGGPSKDHYLSQALKDLTVKINQGKATKDFGLPIVGGILGGTGGLLGEGILPGAGGAVLGASAGKWLGPGALRLAQNPEVLKFSQKAKPIYGGITKGILASILAKEGTQ